VRSPCLCRPLELTTFCEAAARHVRRYTSSARRMSHRPTDAAAEREVLSLCRQGPNAVERAAILPEVVAPRERWAKLAKRTTAELHGRRSPNRPAPKRMAPRHPAWVAQIVARLSVPPHRPDPRPVRRLHRPASTPGNAAGAPPSPLMTEVHSIRQMRSTTRQASDPDHSHGSRRDVTEHSSPHALDGPPARPPGRA
jgi:hypothetical protein